MNLWAEVSPQGSNIWVMPREMYDCVCLCATNKSGKDVVVEIDYSDSKGAAPLGGNSSDGLGGGAIHSIRSDVAAKQTTVIAVFRPQTALLPMQLSYRAHLVAVASKDDEGLVDAHGMRLLMNSNQQSADVESWLRSRRQ
eukprot:GILI01037369.1.p1 GENE.GILI01037369.1~~GILI01037369.1.p1  ORF type:complete len:153 (+),score=24.77 GILI01037369.1:42-461(+)